MVSVIEINYHKNTLSYNNNNKYLLLFTLWMRLNELTNCFYFDDLESLANLELKWTLQNICTREQYYEAYLIEICNMRKCDLPLQTTQCGDLYWHLLVSTLNPQFGFCGHLWFVSEPFLHTTYWRQSSHDAYTPSTLTSSQVIVHILRWRKHRSRCIGARKHNNKWDILDRQRTLHTFTSA